MGKGKKKKSVEYSSEHIFFTVETRRYKLIRFHPSNMSVDVKIIDDSSQKGIITIGFAELPRDIKQKLKPQK